MADNESSNDKNFFNQYSDKQDLLTHVRIAEQAERYDDMAGAMKALADTGVEMGNEERNLLSVAYKNVIGARRTAWRVINEVRRTNLVQERPGYQDLEKIIISYLSTIEKELKKHCLDVLEVLDSRLVSMSHSEEEARIFYLKMKADYQRYLCEICTGNERKERADESMIAYKTASDQAVVLLPPTHPIRLGLQLNFSVFYYEIMDQCERACKIARAAFDDAIAELDTLSEETYRDSTIIMQLLRDNINLWESQQEASQQQGSLLPPEEIQP